MTYYKDLSEYGYHGGTFYRPGTRNIGWLGLEHEFEQAEPADEVLDKLWSFCKISVAQMRGIHECEFCRDDSYFAERKGEMLLLGSSEIRVFSRNGEIYAAPTLIYHYVKSHNYKPPDEFIQAIKEGPAPETQEYFDRLNELDLEWNRTSAPADKPVHFRLIPESVKKISLEMEAYRQSADDDAKSLKNTQIALERLRTLYEKFDDSERQMADYVFSEWVLSENEGLRFDALALIAEMKIDTAIPALHKLAARLLSSMKPSAPYELKKVQRIIATLAGTA